MSETELKQQLVDCIRMLEASDIIDYNGHCSIRAAENRILINTGACTRSKLSTADIVVIDIDIVAVVIIVAVVFHGLLLGDNQLFLLLVLFRVDW